MLRAGYLRMVVNTAEVCSWKQLNDLKQCGLSASLCDYSFHDSGSAPSRDGYSPILKQDPSVNSARHARSHVLFKSAQWIRASLALSPHLFT